MRTERRRRSRSGAAYPASEGTTPVQLELFPDFPPVGPPLVPEPWGHESRPDTRPGETAVDTAGSVDRALRAAD